MARSTDDDYPDSRWRQLGTKVAELGLETEKQYGKNLLKKRTLMRDFLPNMVHVCSE